MLTLFMLLQCAAYFCCEIAEITWVPDSEMFHVLVLLQVGFPSGLMFTLITGKTQTFMHHILMLSKAVGSCCRILTLVTWMRSPRVIITNMIFEFPGQICDEAAVLTRELDIVLLHVVLEVGRRGSDKLTLLTGEIANLVRSGHVHFKVAVNIGLV